ncbi:MAG: hypothetical protein EYC68_19280 [Chloroflexota bacterium]|nr:MAG: hypothetical protein EYC68_19280 [Chloroflexota bacterium]
MNREQLVTQLGTLTGHLTADSPGQKQALEQLHQTIARAFLPEDLQTLKGASFTFENADVFSAETFSAERAAQLDALAEQKTAPADEPELRVFARQTPLRATELLTLVPIWASGAAVEQTLGPFVNQDGRQFWFDFFRIEKLAALYIQGISDPVLLFNVRTRVRVIDNALPPITDLLPTYQLPAGSIWINSQILAPNAPAGFFTGLTIKGGTITLSATPQLVNGKLTIPPNATVRMDLQLQQPAVTDADPTSPYGIDARNAALQLPQKFAFHFSGQGRTLDEISDAQWKVYGQEASFQWNSQAQPTYDKLLKQILIPLNCSAQTFHVTDCQSPFHQIAGEAPIASSAWALPAAAIDILHPTPAAGIGGIVVKTGAGLMGSWQGLQDGPMNFAQPYIMAAPGLVALADIAAGNIFAQQRFELWHVEPPDGRNPYDTSVHVQYPAAALLFYFTFANGNEALSTTVNADVQIDRPVTVAAEKLAIRSRNSALLIAVNKNQKLLYLFDDNILFDNTDVQANPPKIPQPIALALHNALFKVTPVNGCILFGQLADDFVKVQRGTVFLTFGLFAYLPTLPDPYAANIGNLKYQFRGTRATLASTASGGQTIWMWLVCQVKWEPQQDAPDQVAVSFHFAPLQNQFQIQADAEQASAAAPPNENVSMAAVAAPSLCETILTPRQEQIPGAPASDMPTHDFQTTALMETQAVIDVPLPNYQEQWDGLTSCLQQDLFALLDVSTNADLLGVSFNVFGTERFAMVRTFAVAQGSNQFPLQVQGMDVVSQGNNVRAFTVPEISWEPVINTAPKVLPGDPPGIAGGLMPNYYPDDGGPTRLYNNSVQLVPLAPLPVSEFLVDEYKNEKLNITSSLFTLPFGMRALAVLNKFVYPQTPPQIGFNRPEFDDDLKGGLQLQFDAGKLPTDDYPMFNGGTLQINNVLDLNGSDTGASTLGQSVSFIFNEEFKPKLSPNILISRGVPLTRIDFSGYGASIFSNWFNPLAQMAQTSQSKFDVFVGRTAHEVIQVKSIIYPWGIRVVRTIILYRAATGYVYRVDTGWQAESDGKFDFSYYVRYPLNDPKLLGQHPDYKIHPGVVNGLFNIKNIVEEDTPPFKTKTIIHTGEYYLNPNNFPIKNTGADISEDAVLQMVFFDADVEIENVVQGHVNGRVPSKKIMGFVQLAPRGIPLSQEAFKALLAYQPTPIGAPLDCVIDIGKNGQKMRLQRVDVNNSFGANGSDTVFAVAARGSVILPKDGSWSMVQHTRGTGQVTPLPEQLPAPLIRIGDLKYQIIHVDANTQKVVLVPPANVAQNLLRIANPTELLRAPVATTINYGFLHSTDTQKALLLTPAYKLLQGAPNEIPMLLSKTPPLFADAFRIVNSKGIFPNIGDAAGNIGDAISMYTKGTEFLQDALSDGGAKALQLMQINKQVGDAVQEGYKLLKQATDFDLPNTSWTLVELGSSFKIYIEYKADKIKKQDGSTKNQQGKLDFDIDSFAANFEERWKSMMSNVALIVDLGPIKRLMTIKGNWDAKNGAEAAYKGNLADPDFPSPQIEFAPELKPVIDILEILQQLQTENYKEAFQKGLKLAMSNKAASWEYKLEASKEIPVVRFPTPDFLYNDPNAPFKLEAGLKLGAYFNAALKVTTDPKQLLPTAGGFLGFYGRLSVMCVSISIATIYAVGQVNLDIAADTKVGPSLKMKFGFGAQIVVGLPVVGNVSLLYMVGVEIYADSTKLNVSAFLLFQGHAEILGGIIGVTITIEAKGTVSRQNDRTDLAAQVTFALDISIFLVIDISFSESWSEQRQIA